MNKLWLVALFCVFTITHIYAQKDASKTHFTLTNGGWVGGDGAYSIALNDTTRLWLFGDSMIGPIKDNKRSGVDAIHNCLALEAGDGSIHYYLRDKKEPFFINQRKDEYYWPRDGIRIGDKLYVFLARTISQQGGLGFAARGQDLAIVTINSDNPRMADRNKRIAG